MKQKIKYMYYEAGAIESLSSQDMSSWRNEITEKLSSPDCYAYDPVAQESKKVGKPSGEQVKYITGLKQSGHWKKFIEAMHKIWFADIIPDNNYIELFRAMRTKSLMEGNYVEDLYLYGDYEAVCRSSWIILYYPKNTSTVGTIYELFLAMLLNIPVYLILPDMPKTECNSSLLYGVMLSGGEIFYSINDSVKYIKEKYNLAEMPKPEVKKEEEKKKE